MTRRRSDPPLRAISRASLGHMMTYRLSHPLTVDAAPPVVFALVSDVTRTGEWSPQCYRCEWDTGERGVGATFTGHNRTTDQEWSTVSAVVASDPNSEFSWEVVVTGTRWGYRLEPSSTGTLLTEYTEFTETGSAFYVDRYGDDAEKWFTIRRKDADEGIRHTLRRIKALAEDRP